MKSKLYLFPFLIFFLFVSCQNYGDSFNDLNEQIGALSSLSTNYDMSGKSDLLGSSEVLALNDENYKDYEENTFKLVSEAPISTFSVDADGGSYANMRRYLYLEEKPPKASVRIEEYLNYFTFDYPEPNDGENVSLNSELTSCPWNTEHSLLRIGMKGKTIPENELPNSNYVFLIDVSGSMSSPNKLGILKAGFKTMLDNLRDHDRIAIVTYAGEMLCGREERSGT